MIWREAVPFFGGKLVLYGGKGFLSFGGNLTWYSFYVEELRRIFFVFHFVFWPF